MIAEAAVEGFATASGVVPAALLDRLRAVVGERNLKVAEPDSGSLACATLVPASTAEVAEIVRLCRESEVPIVPEGGRTGLVGGTVSARGQVVLSLARMARIERLDPIERTVTVEAGVTLEALQQAAAAHGLEPGIDLAARGSATIGGLVATNAGGIMAFRNGTMRHRVLGIEAVLPDGQVLSDLTRVVKTSAGYDLKHLLIGAEGTLGVVTRVVVKLDPLPLATATVLLGLPSVEAALEAIALAMRTEVGELRAAEGLWPSYIRLTAAAQGWAGPGFDLDQPVNLLLLLGGTDEAALQRNIEGVYEQVLDRYPEATGIVAGSTRQERELWLLREDTDAIYRVHPGAPSFDVSVPLSAMASYVEAILPGLAKVDSGLAPYLFGHLADGNLHVVLNCPGPLPADLATQVEDVLYGGLSAMGGSFSAEHGVGSKRVHALLATADPVKLAAMQTIKRALDGAEIMNPGKVLPRGPARQGGSGPGDALP